MIFQAAVFLAAISTALVLSSLAATAALPLIGGCSSSSTWSFSPSFHSEQNIGHRTFLVRRPPDYTPDTPYPVVLSFHGYGEDQFFQEQRSGFSKDGLMINGRGIIAVYPLAALGPGKNDHAARAWMGAPYSSQDADDITFTLAILDALQTNLCIDASRIYASGMSNGGGFVNLLACTPSTSSKFAAFAPVSPALYAGTLPFDGCDPGRTGVPLITFHGTDDATVPYAGRNVSSNSRSRFHSGGRDDGGNDGASLSTPPIADWVQAWVVRDGCAGDDPGMSSEPYDRVVETAWQCGSNNGSAVVKAFVIDGGTHRWPTKADGPGSFDATSDEILPFFNQWAVG